MSEDLGARHLSSDQLEEIRQGRMLLHHFFSVLRTAAYHASNNVALSEPSERFAEMLVLFLEREGGTVKLEIGDGQMFANTTRIRPSARQRPAIEGLEKFFKRRGLGGLAFKKPLDPPTVRDVLAVVVAFQKPLTAVNGVEGLNAVFQEEGYGDLLSAVEPVVTRVQGDVERLERSLEEVGQLAMQLSKGVAMVKATIEEDSDVARAGTRHVVRQITDLDPEVRDAVVGLSMLGSSDDFSMRSLTVLLVAVAVAEELDATRAFKADLGQACIELAHWDKLLKPGTNDAERPIVGAGAMNWLIQQDKWTLSAMRQGLALASRYLPPAQASPMGRILRVSCDYVDLTTPSPLKPTDPLLKGAPLAPHEAILRMRQRMGSRYDPMVLRALVIGVGLLPVGTPVEMADGNSAVVVERTEDPLVFVVQDTVSRQRRQASFKPGAHQIARVVVGGDLLRVRSHFLLGNDYETLGKISEQMQDAHSG